MARHAKDEINAARHNRKVGQLCPTLPKNFMNFGPQTALKWTGLFTHPHYFFRSSPSHTLYAALTWRRTATLDETALGLCAAQI